MHKILSKSKQPEIGSKAKMLEFLDTLKCTPDFIVLADDFLKSLFGEDINTRYDAEKELKKAILFLGEGSLIVRSSAQNEDSENMSYAGIFVSSVCENKKDLISCIYNTWNSRNSENAAEYARRYSKNIFHSAPNSNKKNKMGIIIQKYIKNAILSVCFAINENNIPFYYMEFSENNSSGLWRNTPDYCLLTKSGIFFSPDSSDYVKNIVPAKLQKLSSQANIVMRNILKNNCTDFELVISKENSYIVQARPAVIGNLPFLRKYALFSSFGNYLETATKSIIDFTESICKLFCIYIPDISVDKNKYVNINGLWIKDFYLKTSKIPSDAFSQELYICFSKLFDDLYIRIAKLFAASDFREIMPLCQLYYDLLLLLNHIAQNGSDRKIANALKKYGTKEFQYKYAKFIKFCDDFIEFPKNLVIDKNDSLYYWVYIALRIKKVISRIKEMFLNKKRLQYLETTNGSEKKLKKNSREQNYIQENSFIKKFGNISIIGTVASSGTAHGKIVAIHDHKNPKKCQIKGSNFKFKLFC